ncbi:MAG: CBS domain-containing protein [Candidatus Micrarchaeia archaeon]
MAKKAKKGKGKRVAKKARTPLAKRVKIVKPTKEAKQAKAMLGIGKKTVAETAVQIGEEPVIRTMPEQVIKASPEEVQNIPITSVMRKGVIVIDCEKTVGDAARLMSRNRIGSLIVMERGKAVGLLTERDIVRKLVARDRQAGIAIKDIMSTPIRVIEDDKPVKDAVVLMKRYGIKRLPVIDKKKRLIGIVTDTDITRALPGMMDLTAELSKISRFEAGIESVGVCNRCGMWSENLTNVGGEFLCDECKQEEEEQYEQ